jgi:hypothetical protein
VEALLMTTVDLGKVYSFNLYNPTAHAENYFTGIIEEK